jgi:hypothetical protein
VRKARHIYKWGASEPEAPHFLQTGIRVRSTKSRLAGDTSPLRGQRMSWTEDRHREVSKPFPAGKITLNNHLPDCINQAQLCRNGTGFPLFSTLFTDCRNAKIYVHKGFPFVKTTATPHLAFMTMSCLFDAGWSSPVARQAHNLKVVSSNLAPATK